MTSRKIIGTPLGVELLIEASASIPTASDHEYQIDVAIYEDGAVQYGDLHISDESWTMFDGSPIALLTLRAIYTDRDMYDACDDPYDAATRALWEQEAESARIWWAKRLAQVYQDGGDIAEEHLESYGMYW